MAYNEMESLKQELESLSKVASDGLQPVISLAKTIQDTLAKSAKSATPAMSAFTGVLGDVLAAAGATSPTLQTAANAVDAIGAAYTLTSGAAKAFSAAQQVLNAHEAANRLTLVATNGALTTQQMLVGLTTGQISLMTAAKGLATKAQLAWNAAMQANHIGMVITLVAGLATGIGLLVSAIKNHMEKDKESNAALEEKRAQLEETRQKYEEARQAQMEQAQADIAQIDRVQQLTDELRTLADESGRVSEQDQIRAQFILGELNGALDTEYTMVDGVIQKYGELSTSIDQVIQKKKAQILLDAQEQSYREALTNAENQAKIVSADYLNVMNQREKVEEAQLARDKKLAETKKYLKEGTLAFNWAMAESEENLKNEQEALDGLTAKYQSSSRELQRWNDEIANYETASGLIQTGQFEEGIQMLNRYSESLMTVAKATKEFGGDQQKINEAITGQAEAAVAGYVAAFKAYEEDASETNRLWLEQVETQAKNALTEYEKIGADSGQGLINGLLSKEDDLRLTGQVIANLIPTQIRANLTINSPSKVMEELGGYVAQGLAVGIRNDDSAQQAAAGQARAILESYQLTLSQEQKDAIRATEAVAEDIQKAFDEAWGRVEEDYDLGLISEAEMYQELGRLRDMYFAEGTREHLKYTRQIADYYACSAKEQMESELEELKFKLDMGWITEEEYYAQLAALRDEYLAYGSEEWKKYTLQIDQYNKKVAAAAEQALQEQKNSILTLFQETAQEAGKAIDEIESRMDQMKQSLDTGSIYEEITTTIKGGSLNKVWKDGEWVNDDITISRVSFAPLEEQVRLLEQYETVLSQLKERGMNEAIFEQFVGYSAEEGVKVGNAMLEMTDEEYSRIEHMLSRRGQLAGEISERMYAGQMEEAAQGMRQALQEEFLSQVPEEFLDGGRLSAEKFGQGFEEKLQELLPGLSQRVQGILSGALQSVVSGGVDSISQVTYNNVYNLNGSKDTVHQQLWEVENFNTIRRHRGIA